MFDLPLRKNEGFEEQAIRLETMLSSLVVSPWYLWGSVRFTVDEEYTWEKKNFQPKLNDLVVDL